jgi:hypothetical protein
MSSLTGHRFYKFFKKRFKFKVIVSSIAKAAGMRIDTFEHYCGFGTDNVDGIHVCSCVSFAELCK